MSTLDRKLIRDLKHLRGQFIAVASVVLCGVAAYVSMSSTYQSLLLSQSTYYQQFRFADIFVQLKRAPESLTPHIRAIPGVAEVNTRIVMEVTLDVPGLNEPATGRLISIPERQVSILNDLFLRQGRYIEPGHSEEVIASEAFTQANQLKVGDTLQAIINGRWKRLQIVGIALTPEYIYEVRGGASFFPDNKRFGVLWMGREALSAAFNLEGAFNDVALKVSPGASQAEVISQLDLLLPRYGGLGAYDREEQTSHRFISDEIAQNKFTGTIVPLIFLGVAVFLLQIVLSRIVSLERNQIAIFKAFGYDNLTIGFHYLKLALVPVWGGVGLGILLGIYLGSKLTTMYLLFYHFPLLRYEVGVGLIVNGICVSLVAAGVSVISALRSAILIPPAEAMQPEPPPHFKAGLLEKIGFFRLFPAAVRMILRNIQRRPMKALFSVLGVAVSAAILIIGMYFFDAMDHILFVQFKMVQLQDVTVVLNDVRPARVRFDLQHLPGVFYSEPFRMVPARLRYEHRSRRIGLLGLSQPSHLRGLVDKDLNTFSLPPDGVVLTTKLAEILGVQPGDTLTVEVLEGARPIRKIPVVRLVDELIGVSAYINLESLNRLTGEGGTISGAYLTIDSKTAPELFAQLKRTPAVGGVSIREVELNSINQTIAQSIAISTTTFVLFACVIAFGIVYNGSRIALSERGRELASLRVLGFTQTEISFLLLGEQAFLTLMGIPIGFAIGFGVCAWIPQAMNTELFRLPFVVNPMTYAFTFCVVAGAAFLSGTFVRWRIRHLDLIAVLKTRE